MICLLRQGKLWHNFGTVDIYTSYKSTEKNGFRVVYDVEYYEK